MGQVKSTTDNLGTAVSGETYEFKKMYPEFIAEAKKEGNKRAEISFDYANKVEQIHADLYQKALDALKNKTPNCQQRTITFAPSAETPLKAQHPIIAQSAQRQKRNS